jgi:hypothetical protein
MRDPQEGEFFRAEALSHAPSVAAGSLWGESGSPGVWLRELFGSPGAFANRNIRRWGTRRLCRDHRDVTTCAEGWIRRTAVPADVELPDAGIQAVGGPLHNVDAVRRWAPQPGSLRSTRAIARRNQARKGHDAPKSDPARPLRRRVHRSLPGTSVAGRQGLPGAPGRHGERARYY